MPKVKEAFVREDASISPKSEEVYDDYLDLSDRVAKVCFVSQGHGRAMYQ